MSQIVKSTDEDWFEWEKICDFCNWDINGFLKPMRYRGLIVPFSHELGVGPHFFNELVQRVNKVKPIRCAVVGDAGSGKTYTTIWLAKVLDPKFTVDQIVLRGEDYIKLQRSLPPRRCIVLDEPTFSLASRTWFESWQKIIVQTIESTRFQNNPLFLPCVNRNLIDKTIREYYLNYIIEMYDRGIARIFRTKHSQWFDRLKRITAYNLYLYGPGMLLSECDRDTCLECPELPDCNKNIFPQYERKRAEAIQYYQKIGEKQLKEVGKEKESFADICNKAVEIRDKLLSPKGDEYMYAEVQYHMDVSVGISRQVCYWLTKHYPLKK